LIRPDNRWKNTATNNQAARTTTRCHFCAYKPASRCPGLKHDAISAHTNQQAAARDRRKNAGRQRLQGGCRTTRQTRTDAKTLAASASRVVAEQLGKPERYVMTSVESNPAMQFAGSDEPLAFLELKSIGLPESVTAGVSEALCQLVSSETGTSTERIYIEFTDAPRKMWGWNNGTF